MITILQPISDSATTIAVTPDPLLPQDSGLILIGSEQITYTTVYMNTLYGCVRGANSTTPAAHAAGSSVTILSFFVANSAGDVTGVHADSNSDITGSVQLVSGTNITLSQSGQAITIDASGGDSGITDLTGDVTATGPGSAAATLATVNTDVGSFTSANITVNAKGLITAAANGSSGPSFPLFATDGTSGAPSYAFASDHTSGLWFDAAATTIALGSGVAEFSIPPTAALAFTVDSDPASIGPRFSYDGTNLNLAFTSGSFALDVPIVSSAPSGVQFTGTLDTNTGMSIVTSFSQPSIVFTASNIPTVTVIGNLVALGAVTDLFPNGAGALSPTAATGFIYVSHSSGGAPTGNPGNNGAMFFDAATNTLYIFSVANGWKSVVLI